MENIYLRLTGRFNDGRLRAVISSGQAVVLHGLAIMSKDGDWILREDDEATTHVLGVLADHGARYRFGAPLDRRWLAGGWSAHFEFRWEGLRVRTDFVTRPPRVAPADLAALWADPPGGPYPAVGLRMLAALKMTNREKDYAIIGEIARLMTGPEDQLRFGRSARDLLALARAHPGLTEALAVGRPALRAIRDGLDALESALDAERRALMRANEARLAGYLDAARTWEERWSAVAARVAGLPLPEAHGVVVAEAMGLLPVRPPTGATGA